MNMLRKVILTLVVTLGVGTFAANAQTKVAHINSQAVRDTMPEYKSAVAELEELNETAYTELGEMEAEIKAAYERYIIKKQAGQTKPAILTMEENRISKNQQDLQLRSQEWEQIIQKRTQELNGPILDKMQKAVKAVCEAKKIAYVLDESVTLFAGGDDITNDVIAQLQKMP